MQEVMILLRVLTIRKVHWAALTSTEEGGGLAAREENFTLSRSSGITAGSLARREACAEEADTTCVRQRAFDNCLIIIIE